jgi:hypothetical protein
MANKWEERSEKVDAHSGMQKDMKTEDGRWTKGRADEPRDGRSGHPQVPPVKHVKAGTNAWMNVGRTNKGVTQNKPVPVWRLAGNKQGLGLFYVLPSSSPLAKLVAAGQGAQQSSQSRV